MMRNCITRKSPRGEGGGCPRKRAGENWGNVYLGTPFDVHLTQDMKVSEMKLGFHVWFVQCSMPRVLSTGNIMLGNLESENYIRSCRSYFSETTPQQTINGRSVWLAVALARTRCRRFISRMEAMWLERALQPNFLVLPHCFVNTKNERSTEQRGYGQAAPVGAYRRQFTHQVKEIQ